jgi:glutathione-regulated potassium-efflux system ancillary protein KefG
MSRLKLPHGPPPVAPGRVLVLLAHPALHRSRINRKLAAAVRGIDGVTVHDLYDAYPDLDLDVNHEKALLLAHPIVVWQHPFYWYSTPPILKEWQDLVLEFGWAYGPGGTALAGKVLLQAITTGGRESAYQPTGFNRYTIRQLLAPVDQTAHLCGMRMLPPFVTHGSHRLTDEEIASAAADYRRVILALRDGTLDVDAVADLPRINLNLDLALGA